MAQRIRIRRDTSANWEQYNPVLSLGEQGYVTDTGQLKIGDGTTAWNSLPFYRGFFSANLQEKLENIEAGAEKNIIKSASIKKGSSSAVPISPDANGNILVDVSDKVDKVTGKGLSTNDYTTAEKNKLADIEAGSQANKIEKIYVNDIEQTITDKTVYLKVENTKKYGVRRRLDDNSSSAWERVGDAVGLVANACKNGNNDVQNDFDSIYPWGDIISYNYNTTTHQRVADYGDADFAFDGSNGIVLTEIPEFYYDRYVEEDTTDNHTYEYIWISEYALKGFKKSKKFSIGRYESSWDGSKLQSISGAFPKISQNIAWFRNRSRELGSGFGQQDYRMFIIQMLYLVEYADYNTQNVLGYGEASYRNNDNDKALVAENNTNRIIVSTSVANNFTVGQAISIGNNSSWNNNVASDRILESKEDYSSGGVTGVAVTFSGSPVNITTTSVLHTSAQLTGKCDSLGMKSGCLNSSSRNAIIYRGVENIFGNIWKFVDGINIKDYEAYVCYDPSQYVSDKFTEPYKKIGYDLFRPAEGATSTSREGYAKSLGYDEENPAVALTTEVGGASNTYMTDYAYINSGNRIALLGGYWAATTTAGLWYWHLNDTSSHTNIILGSRLLLDQD